MIEHVWKKRMSKGRSECPLEELIAQFEDYPRVPHIVLYHPLEFNIYIALVVVIDPLLSLGVW